MNRLQGQNQSRGSSNIIVIVTIIVIVAALGLMIRGHLRNKRFQEIQRDYSSCYQSLCLLEKALMEYARAHKGQYPRKLSELTPKYLKSIPTCPQAAKDTYSASYMAITEKPMYFICCAGNNHMGPPDTPQIVSDLGFLTQNADNPMTLVYENGRMKEIMKLTEESNQLLRKGKYSQALDKLKHLLKLQKSKHDEIYMKMARAYFNLGEDRKAIECLNGAADTKFDLEEWLAMKKWLFKEENSGSVQKILKKYYKNNSDDISCAVILAQLLETSGKSSEARDIFAEGLESGAATAFSPIAELYFKGQRLRLEGKQEESIAYLTSIREVQTENLPAENYICTLSEEFLKKMKKPQL